MTQRAAQGRQSATAPVEKALAAFLRALHARNASAHTVKAYRTDLEEFARFVGPQKLNRIEPTRALNQAKL